MIVARSLVKHYGRLKAVDGVSFEVRRGEILGFLGPNGAGKSTTMKMITGFLPPTAGSASIGGHDVRQDPIAAKRMLGYLPENGPLYPEMTVREMLAFAADLRGLRGAERASALGRVTEICHLEGVRNQPIETLSKGFRQRVGMAQAILHDPPCLIMDEPTDGLDPNQKQEVRKLIAGMAGHKAILLSTHILEEVAAMCNRVIIIDCGRIVADDTPAGLSRRHRHFHALRLTLRQASDRPAARQALETVPAVRSVELEGEDLLVFPRQGEDLLPTVWELARQRSWAVARLEPMPVRLDEVFRDLTRQQAS